MMMQRREHLTIEGLQKIINIRASSPPKERSIYPSPPVVVMGSFGGQSSTYPRVLRRILIKV
jgi:hypothetical protein